MFAVELRNCRIHDHDTLDYIAQLAYIAWPRVAHEGVDRIVGDFFRVPAVLRRELLQEMPCQQWNILRALAQRRHRKRDHVQAIEEVLAEVPLGNFIFEIVIGSSNHARVDRDCVIASDRGEAPFVERAQDLRLRLQAHVPDFIEKQRSIMSLFELANLCRRCSSERTDPVAK